MIDVDKVRSLRRNRRAGIIAAIVCFTAGACPWRLYAEIVLFVFSGYFALRALEYTAVLRDLQITDLPLRERGSAPK